MLCIYKIPIANTKTKNKKQTKCKGRIVVVSGIVIIRNIRSPELRKIKFIKCASTANFIKLSKVDPSSYSMLWRLRINLETSAFQNKKYAP